ncbi:uncharacterized protein Z520_02218 [Fonsecaea multimorphosa CBS 102226]|uniref:Rhamnogalacturonase A/B/Epimerase-like pectate lyase domain-containing protein n=1 Tax=Fonsecaea multimorphosa CBS 102226 TaxID=1442371 RepID=A0A0D2KF83_9EURO|nr:uncharacterized protein Z520_02218 [Fonsecaea multimorphosa CBS 102226]KIY02080.1 hypothetical protein Z520_02218 [Fonsecaea multimorphosa CBS 102226]OAL29279.1 hypothetical protein AYO22_02173 [Fonsecaea multimorphosa]
MASYLILVLCSLYISVSSASQDQYAQSPLNPISIEDIVSPSSNPTNACPYWLEDIPHQGIAAFNPHSSSYHVFRNVKDYGAKGDGVTDETASINLAIKSGDRCDPESCKSSTTTPAVVYFPAGTYMISSSISDYYYTQLIGNPNCMPTLRASRNFTDSTLIDTNFNNRYNATNVFWRQIRNLNIDMTLIAPAKEVTGLKWTASQSTSLQNLRFLMSDAHGTRQTGLYIPEGSGGFLGDLVFHGGRQAAAIGNQQFTMRNLTFYNAGTAINNTWDWSWTYQDINIINCSIGIDMSWGGPRKIDQGVGSVTLLDSSITDTRVGIRTSYNTHPQKPAEGSLVLENIKLKKVDVAVQGLSGPILSGTKGSTTLAIAGWREGNTYTSTGVKKLQGPVSPNTRPASLMSGDKYYVRSKPQYETFPLSQFVSARSIGCRGDGVTDDTAALQAAILASAFSRKILFIDHGTYKVSATVYIPAGARIVGESYSVIMGSGGWFANMNQPFPVLRIGQPGEKGSVELSDLVVSTQASAPGAILMEYNLASPSNSPSGMWDVHARIGGFAGSDLSLKQCPKTPQNRTPPTPINTNCIAAYMTMHLTKSSSGLYLENVWLWVADHDLDDPGQRQITIYAGRGLYDESSLGNFWLVGTASEHHTLYQYQFANTQNVFMGLIQTETAYYQPNPPAYLPFPVNPALRDPNYAAICNSTTFPSSNCSAYALRILNSSSILTYGAGLYSFFSDYGQACLITSSCQPAIFSLEGSLSNIGVYNLNTVGTQNLIVRDGKALVMKTMSTISGFTDTLALFRI